MCPFLLCSRCAIEETGGEIDVKYKEVVKYYTVGLKMGWSIANTVDIFREVLGRISAGTPVILTEVFRVFPQSLQENSGIVPRLDHDCFLPYPF